MAKLKIRWSVKRASINVDEIEDQETKTALENAKSLCYEGQYENAIRKLPTINFEFDGNSLDSDCSNFLKKSTYSFDLDYESSDTSIKIGIQDGNLILSISVIFQVDVHDAIHPEELNEWLSENGGWAAGNAAGMWSYSDDDGGECCVN